MRHIALTDANTRFLMLVEEVERGGEVVITKHGRPIARLLPHDVKKTDDPRWVAAYRSMMARLEVGASLKGLRVDREELYPR